MSLGISVPHLRCWLGSCRPLLVCGQGNRNNVSDRCPVAGHRRLRQRSRDRVKDIWEIWLRNIFTHRVAVSSPFAHNNNLAIIIDRFNDNSRTLIIDLYVLIGIDGVNF